MSQLFLPDANMLIYALNKDAQQHIAARQWLVDATNAHTQIGLCELVEVALLRIATLPKLISMPMSEVIGFWQDDLWKYPYTVRTMPTDQHRKILAQLIKTYELRGNDINDAWIAALAIDYGATLVSADTGYARYRGLRWLNPCA